MKEINDGNSDISLVELKRGTPHCKKHGAMSKVSQDGLWRCLRRDCRAGCIVEQNINYKEANPTNDDTTKGALRVKQRAIKDLEGKPQLTWAEKSTLKALKMEVSKLEIKTKYEVVVELLDGPEFAVKEGLTNKEEAERLLDMAKEDFNGICRKVWIREC